MSVLESPQATWDKRFKQKHYSYRDSQSASTVVLTEIQELVLFAAEAAAGVPGTVYYPFGYNARNNALTGSIFRWPQGPQLPAFAEATGDYASGVIAPRGQCYAREVMVYVTEATWIRFVSLNPIYLTLLAQGYTVARIAAMGVSSTITEVEHYVARRDKDTFYPTYGAAIVFRADETAGTIYISAEGNVEGGE